MELVIGALTRFQIKSTLTEMICDMKSLNDWCREVSRKVAKGINTYFQVVSGVLRFQGKIFVPQDDKLRGQILSKGY